MELVEFAVGDKVEHPKFGKGKITAVYGDGEKMKVVVDFGKEVGERKLLVKLARLKKVTDRTRLDALEDSVEEKNA